MAVRVTVDSQRLRNLRAALRGGRIDGPVLTALAERCRELIIENWSGLYPPASRAGNPPAIRTGALSRSVVIVHEGQVVIVRAGGDGVHYAGFLEYGTRKMAPRPFMLPAAHQVGNEARRIVRDEAGRAIRIAVR